jgi:2-dehydro-3-deoxyphosphogluconate aldolase / (4S)-4-hydroxy-2-oxoglutarate aldolase
MKIIEIFKKHPCIPVLVLNDLKDALPIATALEKGGVRIIEITLRTACAIESIQYLRKTFPSLIIGAGTVLELQQFKEIKAAGAHFAVSPGFSIDLSETAKTLELPYLPGVATPSEVMEAKKQGHTFLKFFPAASWGGVETLKAYQAIFPDVYFCPTGGVGASNFKEYLGLANVLSVGGSWLVPSQAIQNKQWDEITRLAKKALE